MRNLRKLLSRGLKSGSSKRRRSAKRSRNQASVGRQLSSEALEKRELLAGDVVENVNHNYHTAYDVNADYQITVGDALAVLNKLGQIGSEGEAAPDSDEYNVYVDTNNDDKITPADALGVINAIGRGEGVGELVEMFLSPRTADDLEMTPVNGEYNIAVGEKFNLEIAYSDLRTGTEAKGAFQIRADVTSSLPDYLAPVMTETQRFRFDQGVFSDPSLQSVTFTQEGTGTSYVSPAVDFQTNTFIEVVNAMNSFGYTFNTDYKYTPGLEFSDGDQGFLLQWTGATYDDVDVPDILVSIQQSGGTLLEASMAEFSPYLEGPDGTMGTADDVPNSDAVQFNLDLGVRTWSQTYLLLGGLPNAPYYNGLNTGEFDTQRDAVPSRPGFIKTGGVGGLNPQGVKGFDSGFVGATPNDAFSLPVKLVQPVQGLILNVTPSFDLDPEALLLYGEQSPLGPSDVVLDSYDGTGTPTDTGVAGVAHIIINGIGENRDPEVSGPVTQSLTQNDSLTNIDLLEFASDPDNNTLSIDVGSVNFTGNLAGVHVSNNEAIVDPSFYSFLAASEQEVVTISYDIVDGAGGSVAQTATITLTGVNDPATGITGDTTGSVTEDGTLVANGLLTVADLDAGEDEVQPQTNVSGTYGIFSIDAAGSWTYSLNNADLVVQALAAGAAPVDTFAVLSKDGAISVDVIVTINGTNDAPTKGAPVTATFSEEQPVTSVDLLTGASDVDQGDVLSVANYAVTSGDAVGVSQNGNNVDVVPGAYGALEDGQSEVIVLNYDIVDGNGGSVGQTATITVTGVSNFSPVITIEVGDGVVGTVNELAATPSTTTAISSPTGSIVGADTVGPGVGYNYGWQFTVDQPVKISELGAFVGTNFESANDLAPDPDIIRVGLWDVSTGQRLTYVDLGRDTYGGQQGQFVYKSVNPVPLQVGDSYRISVASTSTPLEFSTDVTAQTMEGTGIFSGFQGGLVGQSEGADQYPSTVVAGNSGGFVGGNFMWFEDLPQTATDTLSFSDADPADTHSVNTQETGSDYIGTFSATLTPAVSGLNGEVEWSFSALDAELDELAKDEVRLQIYDVTVTDSNNGSDVEQVTITLNGVNDQPLVTEPISRVFNSGMASENIDLLTGASDVDGDTISVGVGSVSVAGDDQSGVSVDEVNSRVTVTPGAYASLNAGEKEIVEITYTIVDDNGGVVEQTATLTFNGINDPPTPGSPISATFNQNDNVSVVSLITGATDPENDVLTVDQVAYNPANPVGFQIVSNDSVEVTPAEYVSLSVGQDAVVQINYVIDDGNGNQTPVQTATITITGLNDAATITGDTSGAVVEDTALTGGQLTETGTLTVNDVDAGQAIFSTSVTGQAGNLGSLVITEAGVWSYTLDNSLPSVQELAAGVQITDSFTVVSFDGTATENIVITITGVNDAATITGNNEGGVTEDDSDPTLTTSGNLSVTDVDAGEAVFDAVVIDVDSPLGALTIDAAGAWNYSLDNTLPAVQSLPAGATLVDKFEVKSFDQSATETVTVTITGINDVPVFGGDVEGDVQEDDNATLTTSGSLTISDVDTGESFVDTAVSSGVTLGTLTIDVNGNWTYQVDNSTPEIQALVENDEITEDFTITSLDGSETQIVSIKILGTNDVPETVVDERLALKDDTVGILVDVLANDNAGAGGLEIQTISLSSNPDLSETATAGVVGGSAVIEDGKIRYIPNAGFEGTATITYEIVDAGGLTADGTLTVEVVDFVPSTLGGSVFVDHVENFRDVRDNGADPIRNGIKEDDEKGFASVRIKLVSTNNYTGSLIEREVLTDAEGDFEFTNVVPGVYKVVYEHPEQVRYEGSGEYDMTIPALGDVQRNDFNFGLIGTQGAAMASVGLLASSYLRTDATISQISDGGREGGLVCLDSTGQQSFLVLGSGFEGVTFAELELNTTQDAALLTLLTEQGDLLSTILTEEYFVVSNDQCGIQFFGSLNDHFFTEAGSTNGTTFDNTRTAVDDFQDNNSQD